MPDTNQPTYEEDEITLKEVILKIQEFILEAWRHKWWIVAAGLGFAAVFLIRAMLEKPTYTATLTFMVNEDEGGSMGGIATILGQFGLGGGANSGRYNLDKIVALSRSRKIVQEVLFEKTELNGKNDYLANHIIDIYEYHEAWAEDDSLAGFYFKNDETTTFTPVENRALLNVYGRMRGNPEEGIPGVVNVSYRDETKILQLNTQSLREDLSIILANVLYEKLSQFYVDKATESQKQTFDKLQAKTDSIYNELSSAEYQLAKFNDSSLGVVQQKDNLERNRLSRLVQVLTVMYGEAIKNKETAEFLLKSATPVFQVIDRPLAPIRPQAPSKFRAILLGGIIGGVLGVIFVIGRSLIRQALAEDESTEFYA